MQRRRLVIVLTPDEYKQLQKIAREQRRIAEHQASWMLAELLRQPEPAREPVAA